MPKLFIGLPVYNGEEFIEEAINSIRNQTYTDWEMLISDNCSTDNTEEICRNYCELDSRIRYYKQSENKGGEGNYKFLINSANNKYFMCATHDDIWEPEFISSCIENLEKDSECKMAFTNVIYINKVGRTIRLCPCYSRFSHNVQNINIIKNLIEAEFIGKSILMYSIFDTDFCRNIYQNIYAPQDPDCRNVNLKEGEFKGSWGSDSIYTLALLSRTRLKINKSILFKKRTPQNEEKLIKKINNNIRSELLFPYPYSKMYVLDTINVLKGTPYYLIGIIIMFFRFCEVFFIEMKRRFIFNKIKIKMLLKALKNDIISIFKNERNLNESKSVS